MVKGRIEFSISFLEPKGNYVPNGNVQLLCCINSNCVFSKTIPLWGQVSESVSLQPSYKGSFLNLKLLACKSPVSNQDYSSVQVSGRRFSGYFFLYRVCSMKAVLSAAFLMWDRQTVFIKIVYTKRTVFMKQNPVCQDIAFHGFSSLYIVFKYIK